MIIVTIVCAAFGAIAGIVFYIAVVLINRAHNKLTGEIDPAKEQAAAAKLELLESLNNLKECGAITQKEFENEKRKLLSS